MVEPHAHARAEAPGAEPPLDVRERGAQRDGQPPLLDGRLFMQLLVFGCAPEPGPAHVVPKLVAALRAAGMGSVLYEDVNDPFALGLLTFTEEPADFLTKVRPAVAALGTAVSVRPDFTMLGRTYSSGYEADLDFWL